MTLAEVRDEVKKCDQEIQSIKAALRGIAANSSEPNSVEIEFTHVEGLPESAKPMLSLQLSSPIESRELTLDGGKVTFTGVETSMATLSVEAKDADVALGSCANPIEIAPLCVLEDPKQPKDEYVSDVPIAIVAATGAEAVDAAGGEKEATVVAAEPVVCSVTLKVTYKPSPKDQREELYDLLNKTSQRKAEALAALRSLSMKQAGSLSAGNQSSSTAVTKSSSVKPGFLNKGGGGIGKEDNENGGGKGLLSTVKKWYGRVTGPDSIVRKAAFWTVATKDFWIFFGAVGLFHYRGNALALPPPV